MKVLIAEDEPVLLETLSACMEEEGFEVVQAANGQEALDAFERESPDLICLDIMMPKVDGFQACEKIRSLDATIPILFLSAKNEEQDILRGFDLGADDFVRKPFTRNEVMARVRAILRRSGPPKPVSFQMGTLTVFPKQLYAERKEGEAIELSLREVQILSLLHRQANLPVSRNELLNECWGLDYFPDSRTLDQHILVLRKKVEDTPSSPQIIQTVRSVGYLFKEG